MPREAVESRITEIDRELAAIAALRSERDRLTEALRLLGQEPPPPSRRRPTAVGARRRPSSAVTGKSTNRDAVLEYVAVTLGAPAGAIVEHLSASRGVVYDLLARLVERGAIERHPGPGGRARYRVGDGSARRDADPAHPPRVVKPSRQLG